MNVHVKEILHISNNLKQALNRKGLLGKEIKYELQNLSIRLRNDNNIAMLEMLMFETMLQRIRNIRN
jgi:hypothetical protein